MTEKTFVPFSITGVKTSLVGTPSNDGSPGSALYAVPLSLSRPLTGAEQEAMVAVWDNPPSSTTMHRPGTARCYGTEFVLSKTTIEEVRDYHLKTLQGVVAKVNELSEAQHRRDATAEAERKAQAEAHAKNVEKIAKDMDF
ncbi:hypothetical protein [Pseudarthrobacter polychromogenes]|uniref:Uncharacterized protein n=1 Tax=Pseudarthrobacter polychromogenes TaxID=1676 RepID=A0ABQ1XDB7_9MICC|nr:hypothetical protein [Pseudarthrobacter polychromogenes]GGG83712.1 hypothetical protein GCM10011577_01440 [Pseudarthrobacter polychromogenes]